MSNQEFSRTSLDTFGTNKVVSQSVDYNLFIAQPGPIQGIRYPQSSLQASQWFCDPAYFMIEKEDGTHDVFCWTFDRYHGHTMNYIWKICWNLNFQPVFGIDMQFQHSGPSPFCVGDYLFHTELGSRAVWRRSKALNTFTSPYTSVNIYSSPQPQWLKICTSIFITDNILTVPRSAPGRPDYMPQVIESFFQLPPSPFESDFNSPLDSDCATPTQSSDTSSDISVDIYDPSTLKADQAIQDQTYFSVEEGGVWRLNVPDLKTKDEVKHYLEIALPQLGKKVREVKCSLCEKKKVDKLWKVKPSNLERHILGHLGIKTFECPTCGALFTTKDQEKKHAEKKHTGLQEVDAHGGTSHKPAEEGAPCDMYSELPPTTPPFLGVIEPWMKYWSYQGLQTECVVPGGEYCNLMNGYR